MSDLSGVLGGSFNAQDHYEEEPSFDLLPDLDAVLMVTSAEVKDTQNGGMGINMQIEVIQDMGFNDKYKGRKVFEWINIAHPTSEVAVNIGKATLSRYALACGLQVVNDTSELLNKPFLAQISRRKDKKTGEDRQIIKNVQPMQSTQPAMTQPAQQSAQQPAFNAQQGAPTNPFAK